EIPQDVVDSVVIQALMFNSTFRGDAKFSTWFHTIVKSRCMNYLRGRIRTRKREVSIEDVEPEASVDLPAIDLDRVLGGLQERDQRILALKKEGYQEAEIAELLGMNKKTVNTRVQRLKKRITRKLA